MIKSGDNEKISPCLLFTVEFYCLKLPVIKWTHTNCHMGEQRTATKQNEI